MSQYIYGKIITTIIAYTQTRGPSGPGLLTWILFKVSYLSIWASMRENLSSGLENNKGADQPAHPHSLIRAFVIRLLECIISRLATSEIFEVVSVAEQAGLNLTLSETQKTGFLTSRPI